MTGPLEQLATFAIGQATAELKRLYAVERAVRKLHVRDEDTDSCPQCGRAWPCPTVRALDVNP